MSQQLSVSIIINTLNRADLLERTLRSLRQLRYPRFEVIVVNGPSADHTAEVIANHADWVRSGSCAEANLSKSRNVGIAMAKGDIVAFIDDDAVPEPDWLDHLVLGYADPAVAAVGGFIRDHAGVGYQCKVVVADRFGDSSSHETLEGELSDRRYLSLTGTNSSFRRAVVVEEGGFDEAYAYFLDETDVNLRLVDRGWKAAIVPDAEIHHKFAASHLRETNRIPRSMYVIARSKAYFCCVNAIKTNSLAEVVDYLGRFIRSERRWKTQMYFQKQIDRTTSDRLIAEVEKGVADGARAAFAQSSRKLLSPELLARHSGDTFRTFPLRRPAKQRLRICFLSQDYPPAGYGGIGQWTREAAIGLAERGHEVTVISRSDQPHPYVEFSEGVWVHRISPGAAPVGAAKAYAPAPASLVDYSASAAAEVRRIQARRDFQIISGPIWDLEPLVALRETGVPTVLSLHTTFKLALPHKPDWLANHGYRRAHVEPVIEKERELLESVPFLLANSHSLVADIEQQYGIRIDKDRLTVIPHGLHDLSVGVEAWPKTAGEFRLLFVGRLELRKGADLLLAALPQLLSKFPQLIVDIVGNDEILVEGSTLRAKFLSDNSALGAALERVRFHGVVSREDLLRYYCTCDLAVMPSRYESFGLIFVEAMMFAKPTVGIAVGGVTEVIDNGRDGILIPHADAGELEARVAELIGNPQALVELGAAARSSFERKFVFTRMIDALEAYYLGIANREGRRSQPPLLAQAGT